MPVAAALADREPVTRAERLLLLVLAVALAGIVLLVLHGDRALLNRLMSEDGPFERGAAALWLVLALVLLWTQRPWHRHALALAAIALLFCLRELDLHKFIADTSFLKNAFFRSPDLSPGQKLLGAVMAASTVGIVLWGLAINARAYWRGRLHRRAWGRIVLACAVLLPLSKVFDRLPATLKVDAGIELSWTASHLVTAPEELLECLIPAALLVAAWMARRRPLPSPP